MVTTENTAGPLPEGVTRAEEPFGFRRFLRIALGFGLVAGWLELALVLSQRAFDPRITMATLRTNRHFAWMIPVSDAAVFGASGLVLGILSLAAPALARRIAGRVFAVMLLAALLLHFEELSGLASASLALGLGSAVGPVAWRRASRRGRAVGVGLGVLAAALVALLAIDLGADATAEARARAGRPPASPGRPNIVLLVLDNVRADSLSLYGHDRPTSPNLERLARRGIRFDQARSTAPWTLPSHASMFTGRWGHELSVDWDRALDATFPTLAEYLAGRGYVTAGFVGNTYYCNARYGLGRGFDRYEDFVENQAVSAYEVVHASALGRRVLATLGYPVEVRPGESHCRKAAARINADVLSWLDTCPEDRPFFVFANYFDAHAPFLPPEGEGRRFGMASRSRAEQAEILSQFQRRNEGKPKPGDRDPARNEREAIEVFRDGYESCIAYLDEQVGRLVDELERRGRLEKTLLIVTSDHGEHFNEHGFLGHGLSVYRREVHVPLLILPPGSAEWPRGHRVDEPVSLRDLAATAVGFVGLGDGSPFPGQSLARLWTGADTRRATLDPPLSEVGHQKRFPRMANVPASLGPVQSLVSGGNVYIHNHDGREELYDLVGDPLERTNLADDRRYRPTLLGFRARLGGRMAGPESVPGEEFVRRDEVKPQDSRVD